MRRSLAALAAVALLGTTLASPPAAADPDDRPQRLQALTVLPPGNSMHITLDGFLAGTLTGDPEAFGDHLDDQRALYWDHEFKDGGFREECDAPEEPGRSARLCFDEFGVPAVYADSLEDAWYGAGHAAVQQRLFLMDAVRRTARGTLSELTGPDGVPADVATRVQGYADDELQAMLRALSPEAHAVARAHLDGINDAITATRLDPTSMPAEYVLLQTLPEPFTEVDLAAMGVLMTREVASEGGTEMDNVASLRSLESALGTRAGRDAWQDLHWVEDTEATVTVPPEEGVFARSSASARQRTTAFETMADHAASLPLELARGDGTGGFPRPEPLPLPDGLPEVAGLPTIPAELRDEAIRSRITESLTAFPSKLQGGSFGVAIGPERTADGSTLLISEPQLLFDPVLLWELEVHAPGTSVRGSTVPGLPVVGIGYTPRHAWAVTTGMSQTVQSFVSPLRTGDDGRREHRHDGTWKPLECRDEIVRYRTTVEGVPIGPPLGSVEVEACRTVHGPLVATSEDGELGRATRYAMWERELETLEGLLGWNLATSFDEFEAAVRKVTWNENTLYADVDGRIAYWHPGLHRQLDPGSDPRLPTPGTGELDGDGFLPFARLPHAVDPAQGWLANWNNKPAHGWLDGESQPYTALPAGRHHRTTTLVDELSARDDWSFDALRDLDRIAGSRDPRATALRPMLLDLRERDDLPSLQREALQVLAGWDGSATGPGADERFVEGEPGTVGAAWTIFDRFARRLPALVLTELEAADPDLLARRNRVSSGHPFDVSPALNLTLRVLDPSTSSLTPAYDHLDGRDADEVLATAFATVLDELVAEHGHDDLATWRTGMAMTSVCNPTGLVGPCVDMPLLERGTWIHLVGFGGEAAATPDDIPDDADDVPDGAAPDNGAAPAPEADPPDDTTPSEPGNGPAHEMVAATPVASPARPPLPVTGGSAVLGLLLLGAALATSWRRRDV